MAKKNSRIEEISLDIANHWSVNKDLDELNDRSGTLVGFDWKRYKDELYLSCVFKTLFSLFSLKIFLYLKDPVLDMSEKLSFKKLQRRQKIC